MSRIEARISLAGSRSERLLGAEYWLACLLACFLSSKRKHSGARSWSRVIGKEESQSVNPDELRGRRGIVTLTERAISLEITARSVHRPGYYKRAGR
jgi:hypothetical protein